MASSSWGGLGGLSEAADALGRLRHKELPLGNRMKVLAFEYLFD
jgi:hypothetical protein